MISGNMPKSLYQNWQFAIEVNGFDVALFRKGGEPKTEFEEVAFAPAGSMFDQKVAGRVKFDDITLEKGVLQDGADVAALDWINPALALTLLGIFLVLVGLVFLLLPTRTEGIRWPFWAGPLAGLMGGVLGGLFGTGAPPVIIYFHLSRLHKSTFRGQLMVVLNAITLARVPSYAVAGFFTAARLWSGLAIIPWVAVGALGGYRLHLELNEATFRRVVSVLLAAMGVMLLAR